MNSGDSKRWYYVVSPESFRELRDLRCKLGGHARYGRGYVKAKHIIILTEGAPPMYRRVASKESFRPAAKKETHAP